MGVSLTYSVRRDKKILEEEKKVIGQIVEVYRVKDVEDMDWRGENIETPTYDMHDSAVILAGSIEIGHYEDDYEREIEEVVRWCYCLSEIARNLTGGEWTVRLGDEELVFDTQIGFHLRKLPKSLHEELKPVL